MLHTRLDTLETVNIASPAISPRILYGIAYPSDIVRTSALAPSPSPSHPIAYLRLTPSAKWAVRLIEQWDLSTRAAQLAYLSRRDGWSCFYCDQPITEHTATIEHIISTAHGGPTHADNLCLSCGPCNAAMGSLPGVQKMRLAIGARVGAVAVTALNRRNRKGGTK